MNDQDLQFECHHCHLEHPYSLALHFNEDDGTTTEFCQLCCETCDGCELVCKPGDSIITPQNQFLCKSCHRDLVEVGDLVEIVENPNTHDSYHCDICKGKPFQFTLGAKNVSLKSPKGCEQIVYGECPKCINRWKSDSSVDIEKLLVQLKPILLKLASSEASGKDLDDHERIQGILDEFAPSLKATNKQLDKFEEEARKRVHAECVSALESTNEFLDLFHNNKKRHI